MEYFEKKITYLRGLCDGSDFPADSKEGKIFHGILDVLDDMAFMLETFMDDEEMVMMMKKWMQQMSLSFSTLSSVPTAARKSM